MTLLNLFLTLLGWRRNRLPTDTVRVKRTKGTSTLGSDQTAGYDNPRRASRLAPSLSEVPATETKSSVGSVARSRSADPGRDREEMNTEKLDCPNCGSHLEHPTHTACEDCSFHLEVYEDRQEAMAAFRRHLAEPDTIVTDPVPVPGLGWALSHTRLMLV